MKINAMITDIKNLNYLPENIKKANQEEFYKSQQGYVFSLGYFVGIAPQENHSQIVAKAIKIIDLDNFNSVPINLLALFNLKSRSYEFMGNIYEEKELSIGSLWQVEFRHTFSTKNKYKIKNVLPENEIDISTKGQYFIEAVLKNGKTTAFVNNRVDRSYPKIPSGNVYAADSYIDNKLRFSGVHLKWPNVLDYGFTESLDSNHLNWFESMAIKRFKSKKAAEWYCHMLNKKQGSEQLSFKVNTVNTTKQDVYEYVDLSKHLTNGLAWLFDGQRYFLNENHAGVGGYQLVNVDNELNILVDSKEKMAVLINQLLNLDFQMEKEIQQEIGDRRIDSVHHSKIEANQFIGQAFTDGFKNALN